MSRIAVLAHAYHSIAEPYEGGLEMHTALLCDHLSRLGHDVVLFAKEGSESTSYEVRSTLPKQFVYRSGLTRFELRRQSGVMHDSMEDALRQVELGGFDHVINNSLSNAPLEWQTDIPVLTVFHTPVFKEIVSAARKATTRRNNCFVTVSETNAANWRPLVPSVQVAYNGVEMSTWKMSSDKTDELRWSARITPEKGLHIAVEAARLTGRTLRFAGPVSDEHYFRSVIEPMLSDTIVYEGHLSHERLVGFLGSGAVALATPEWEEPFGLSVVESLACGTPVAALPRGAMAELLNDEVGAIALNSSSAALAVAIEQAAECDPNACRTHAEDRFDAEAMVRQYLEAFEPVDSVGPAMTAPQDDDSCAAV